MGALICESFTYYHLLIKIWICKRELEQSAIDFGNLACLDYMRDGGIGLLHRDTVSSFCSRLKLNDREKVSPDIDVIYWTSI